MQSSELSVHRPKALNELVMNDKVYLKGMANQRLSSRDGSNL